MGEVECEEKVTAMNLNDLLRGKGIDPEHVLVLRHRPTEPELNEVLPWLAAEKPEVFNAYQQTQGEKLEKAMLRASYVASFIGREAGRAFHRLVFDQRIETSDIRAVLAGSRPH